MEYEFTVIAPVELRDQLARFELGDWPRSCCGASGAHADRVTVRRSFRCRRRARGGRRPRVSADSTDPRGQDSAKADQALAGTVRASLHGPRPGWAGGAVEARLSLQVPVCRRQPAQRHDLTITGHAESIADARERRPQVDSDVRDLQVARRRSAKLVQARAPASQPRDVPEVQPRSSQVAGHGRHDRRQSRSSRWPRRATCAGSTA